MVLGSAKVTGSGQVATGNVTQAANSFSQTISSGIPGTTYVPSNINIQHSGQTTTPTTTS